MDFEGIDTEVAAALEIALTSGALFEQYDDSEIVDRASNDSYENLYPNVA